MAVVAGLAFLLLGSSSQLSGPIAQAATVSSNAPGYRMHMSVVVSSSAVTVPVTISGSGTVDLRDRATSMSISMNLASEPQMARQLGSNTLRIDMITDGDVVYAKLPPAVSPGLATGGKHWIKIDLTKFAGLPGLSSLQSSPTTSDPNQILRSLRSLSHGIVNEGSDRVDGFETTHYRAELSLARMLSALSAPTGSAAQQAISALEQSAQTADFPVDVWVDASHLVRRIVLALDLNLPDAASLQETLTMDLSHYGPQRPPATPPAGDTLDLSDAAGVAGG